jgi:hypothetical protein
MSNLTIEQIEIYKLIEKLTSILFDMVTGQINDSVASSEFNRILKNLGDKTK